MRAVVIRVSRASITINGEAGGSMDKGFVVLVGVKPEDTTQEAAYLAKKCAEMRVFEDENGNCDLYLTITVYDKGQLEFVMNRLMRVSGVSEVKRIVAGG